jgi:hypothetical protein
MIIRTEEVSSSTVSDLWSQVQPQIQAAQAVAAARYTRFDKSVVITRIFVTAPFDSLPEASKEFVRNRAELAGACLSHG